MRMSWSRYIHNMIWQDCDHSVCAHAWERRHLRGWLVAVVLLNIGGFVWHALRDWRLVTDHVQRSWRFYHGGK